MRQAAQKSCASKMNRQWWGCTGSRSSRAATPPVTLVVVAGLADGSTGVGSVATFLLLTAQLLLLPRSLARAGVAPAGHRSIDLLSSFFFSSDDSGQISLDHQRSGKGALRDAQR